MMDVSYIQLVSRKKKQITQTIQLLFRDIMQIIRRKTESVPIFAFSFGSTSMILRVLIRGDVPAQAERLSRETGKPIEDLLIQVRYLRPVERFLVSSLPELCFFFQFYQPNEGTIINIPGLFPMYDYEIVPQLSVCITYYYTLTLNLISENANLLHLSLSY